MGIPALRSGGQLISESSGKAEILNYQFESIFTNENPMVNPWLNKMKTFSSRSRWCSCSNSQIAKQLAPALTHIFNKSLVTGILPADWLSANISSIFLKKGIEPLPPITGCMSLTPICCKLFEHIGLPVQHSNIMRHFSEHQILTDRQLGFCANFSCQSPLVLTVNNLAKSIDTKTSVCQHDYYGL